MSQPSPAVAREAPAEEVSADVIPISDRVLLQRHAEGDKHAFPELMKTHAAPIYRFLARSGAAPAECDDLFQEVFIKVHRAALAAPPRGSVRPWLYAIAANTVRSHFRSARVRSIVKLTADPESGPALVAPDSGPHRTLEARERARWLEGALERLPQPQREVFALCCLEGLDVAEVAEALDEPVETIKTRLRRSRLALAAAAARSAQELEREGTR